MHTFHFWLWWLSCVFFLMGCVQHQQFIPRPDSKTITVAACPQLPTTQFQLVGIVDLRYQALDEFYKLAQPGDLIVNYMRLGRAAKQREWLFAILPYGHSILVLDPNTPDGLLECRFHGAQRVPPEELYRYTYNLIYRLQDAERLNQARLREFADEVLCRCQKYRFKTWWRRNGFLTPNQPDQILESYSCSTMVAAAYHYAGVTLSVNEKSRVITPLRLAGAVGVWNQFADLPNGIDSVEIDHWLGIENNSNYWYLN